jgi:hypothetical protein
MATTGISHNFIDLTGTVFGRLTMGVFRKLSCRHGAEADPEAFPGSY